ncbi:probable disease resistance protein At4g19520 isoform X2 [Typha latifolia]|uniref:probable disease resistance protein At4g19520 isoform X2 n=1 Tax=Typha latifolia TaxID=4733 RepID=UPI003C2EAFE4
MDSVKRVGSPPDRGTEVSVFPSLRVLYIKHMPALEEFYGGARTSRWLPSLKSLSIIRCPKLRMFPNLPCGLRNVYIESVNWTALPELWQGGLSTSSSSSLSSLEISDCRGLVSLSKGFEKFTSLKELRVMGCPKLQRGSTTQRFLPLSLECLAVEDCNVLDALPKIPEDLNFLSEVKLKRCANIKSLPPAEVLGRWKALRRLSIEECSELRSLGGLQALSSLKYLTVEECPKLLAAASSSPSSLAVENHSSLTLEHLVIDNPVVLSTVPLKSIAAREVYIGRCNEVRSSTLEGWVLRNRTSLQVLKLGSVFSRHFPLVDLRSLSCLKRLGVDWCRKLQSLPRLPASLNKFCLYFCSPELEERCLRDSGPDWRQIRHIPYVQIGKYNKEKLATITPAEHRSRTRELEEDSS